MEPGDSSDYIPCSPNMEYNEPERPRPRFAWSYIACKHPWKAFIIISLIPCICIAIIYFLGLFKLAPLDIDGFFVLDDARTKRYQSRRAALKEYRFDEFGRKGKPERSIDRKDRMLILVLRSTSMTSRMGKYLPSLFSSKSANGNVLTPEGLAAMKRAEDTIMNLPNYTRYCYNDGKDGCDGRKRRCATPLSLTLNPLLYGDTKIVNQSMEVCGLKKGSKPVDIIKYGAFLATLFPDQLAKPEHQEFLNAALKDSGVGELPIDEIKKMRLAIGKDFSEKNPTTQVLRSVFRIGSPFRGDGLIAELDEIRKWAVSTVDPAIAKLSDARFHIQVVSVALLLPLIEKAASRDALFAVGSVVLVFIVVAIHTKSLFLAVITILQIALSFPITFVLYRAIGITHFGNLNITTLFLLLGIGADDVFIFTDAWRQAPEKLGLDCELVDRMIYTYRRSVKAMSITTLTTAIAFLTTLSSKMMPIVTLGVWAAILIVVQFLLVVTIYPCALIIHHKLFADKFFFKVGLRKKVDDDEEQMKMTGKHVCEEEIDMDAKLCPNLKSQTVRQPRLSDYKTKTNSLMSKFESVKSVIRGYTSEGYEYRPVEKWFNGKWCNWMHKFRFPLIIVALGLLAASIYCTLQLQPPRKQEQAISDSDPMYSALVLQTTAFPTLDDGQIIIFDVVFGLRNSTDRTGISVWDAANEGNATLDNRFSLRTKEAQEGLLKACDFFDVLASRKGAKISKCWIRDFKKWRKSGTSTNNTANSATPSTQAFETYGSEKEFAAEILRFGKAKVGRAHPYLDYLKKGSIGLTKEQDRVVFTRLSFATELKIFGPFSETNKAYKRWDELFERYLKTVSVDALKRPFLTCGQSCPWMRTQWQLQRTAMTGLGIMLAVAMLSLTISTGNVIVASVALLCIASIILNILAVIFLLGWDVGIAESICIVVAVGFSFDYVAHLVNAYVESEEVERFERTRDALTELGISVIAGATSTFLAGCMLLFAKLVLLFKFGVLIVTTIGFSVVWSLVFLPAFLHTVGPNGNMGKVSSLFCCFRKTQV